MRLYYEFQPVTWYIGVVEATPYSVSHAIRPRYAPKTESQDEALIAQSVDRALLSMQPLKVADKLLLLETRDGHTALLGNAFYALIEQVTWHAASILAVPAFYICNEPCTITSDQRIGRYGARVLEYREPKDPYGQDPTFRVSVINDAGRWCFERYGERLAFEEEQAYKAHRKASRFTVDGLVRYCHELGIPVYDKELYSGRSMMIRRAPLPNITGLTYENARRELRIVDAQQYYL